MVLLGVLCLFRPGAALVSSVWVLGIILLITGISTMAFSLRTQVIMPNSASSMLSGIVQILMGCLFLFNPVVTAASLPLILAIWIVFESISLAIRSFDFKKVGFSSWWLMLLLGILGVVLGFVAIYHLPEYTEGTSKVMGVFVGLAIIVAGLVRLVALTGIRKFEKRINEVRDDFTDRANEVRDQINEVRDQINDRLNEARDRLNEEQPPTNNPQE